MSDINITPDSFYWNESFSDSVTDSSGIDSLSSSSPILSSTEVNSPYNSTTQIQSNTFENDSNLKSSQTETFNENLNGLNIKLVIL